MTSILSGPPGPHRTAQLKASVRYGLRELGIGMSHLNHRVGAQLGLNDVDFDCINLVARHGPLSPSDLARRSGLHPATVTGVLDRLEESGWVARERDQRDRRAVRVHFIATRASQIASLFAGMNSAMRQVLRAYSDEELAVISDFLERTTVASREAAARLSGTKGP